MRRRREVPEPRERWPDVVLVKGRDGVRWERNDGLIVHCAAPEGGRDEDRAVPRRIGIVALLLFAPSWLG